MPDARGPGLPEMRRSFGDLAGRASLTKGAVVMPSATYKGQPKITMLHPSGPVQLQWVCRNGCFRSAFELAERETVDTPRCANCGHVMRLYRPTATQGRL